MEIPLIFTLTFAFFFVMGGISGMCVAHTGMDILFLIQSVNREKMNMISLFLAQIFEVFV